MSKDKKNIVDIDDVDDVDELDDKKDSGDNIVENTDVNLILNSFEYYDKNNQKIKDKQNQEGGN